VACIAQLQARVTGLKFRMNSLVKVEISLLGFFMTNTRGPYWNIHGVSVRNPPK